MREPLLFQKKRDIFCAAGINDGYPLPLGSAFGSGKSSVRKWQLMKSKSPRNHTISRTFGTAEGIRTPDLLVRSQSLYPTELQPHILFCAFLQGREKEKQKGSIQGMEPFCKGRLKSIFLFLVQKAPQLIKQGRSAQCQLPVLGQYSTQADRSDSVPHSGNALHFPM